MCSSWAGFIMIHQRDLISSNLTSFLLFLFYSILRSPPRLYFSPHDTTHPQPLVPAPRQLPPLHPLSCPQMTSPALRTSWRRCGYAMFGACRTARAWMRSAKRVEVNICAVWLVLHLFAFSDWQVRTLSVEQCSIWKKNGQNEVALKLKYVSNYPQYFKTPLCWCGCIFHRWFGGPGRGQRWPVRGQTGHNLLGSGARRDGQPWRRPD